MAWIKIKDTYLNSDQVIRVTSRVSKHRHYIQFILCDGKCNETSYIPTEIFDKVWQRLFFALAGDKLIDIEKIVNEFILLPV